MIPHRFVSVALVVFAASCVDAPRVPSSAASSSVSAQVSLTAATPPRPGRGTGALELDIDDDEPPAHLGPMTEEAAQSKRLFDAGKWLEAAVALKRVDAGDTGDDQGNKELAQYRLAIALFRLEFVQSSFGIFAQIAENTEHVKHREALPWLARLALSLPEPADLVQRVGTYDEAELARFDSSGQRELFAQLHTMFGRLAHRKGDSTRAIALLEKVDSTSDFYLSAQFAIGSAARSLREPARAAEAFQQVASTIGDGPVSPEATRLRNLAHLLRGSALWASEMQPDSDGTISLTPKKAQAAITAWQQVEPTSEYWLDAAVHVATAYIIVGDFRNGLKAVAWLQASDAGASVDLEVDTLNATALYRLCRYDEADAAVSQITKEHEGTATALATLVDAPAFKGDDGMRAIFDFALAARAGTASIPASIKPAVEAALGDRGLSAQLAYLQLLEQEQARHSRTPAGLRSSPLGADILDAVSLGQELVKHSAGNRSLLLLKTLTRDLTPSHSQLLTTITRAGKTRTDRDAARALLLAQLDTRQTGQSGARFEFQRLTPDGRGSVPAMPSGQGGARLVAATPELNGRGRKPADPKPLPATPTTMSKCP